MEIGGFVYSPTLAQEIRRNGAVAVASNRLRIEAIQKGSPPPTMGEILKLAKKFKKDYLTSK